MKVKELIALLKEQDGERIVIVPDKDIKGAYAPLGGIEPGAYYDGMFGLDKLTKEDIEHFQFTEDDVLKGRGSVPALKLWPSYE